MKKKLTDRQKRLASDQYPTYGGQATWPEVKRAKIAARGRYWHWNDFEQFVAYTPDGKREYFVYDDEWKNEVKKCARLWSLGKKKEAIELYDSYWDGSCFRSKDDEDPIKTQLKNAFRSI